jgi:hypothetical protein
VCVCVCVCVCVTVTHLVRGIVGKTITEEVDRINTAIASGLIECTHNVGAPCSAVRAFE